MRILVTGSRFWTSEPPIYETLLRWWGEPQVTLVSGACPPRWVDGVFYKGADRICEEAARAYGWTVELHPAEWTLHGKRAGFLRNQEMVDLGADYCCAFILNNSAGATMTERIARKAGIPTIVVREER